MAPTANHLTTLLYFQRAAHQPGGPRNPTQDGNAWAASSRAIHVHLHRLQRPDQDRRSSPAAPSSYRPTPWPSTQRQNWNCFLDVAVALRVLGAPAAYCRTTILLLQVTDFGLLRDTMRIGLRSRLSASSPSSTKNAAHTSARMGPCCRRKPDGSRRLPRVPGKLVTMYPDIAPHKAPWPIEAASSSLCTPCVHGDQTTGNRGGGTSPGTPWSHVNTSTTS
jgi:hypothetical protein